MSQFDALRLFLKANPGAHEGWAALQVRLAREDVTEEDHAVRLAFLRRWIEPAPRDERDAFHVVLGWWRLTRRGRVVSVQVLTQATEAAA